MMQFPLRHRRSAGLVTTILLILSSLVLSRTAFAQTDRPPPTVNRPSDVAPQPQPNQEEWRGRMTREPLPKSGCFTSSYPSGEWREVPCTTPLPRPYPARGPRPTIVGNGNDFMIDAAHANISLAEGSFGRVAGAISVVDSLTGKANTFSLQLNANFFNTPLCAGRPNCQGWQQFIFSTDDCGSACSFMQYWLLGFGPQCPATGGGVTGWMKPGPQFPDDCFANSFSVPVPQQTIAGLRNFVLTGSAAGGGLDTVFMSVGNPPILFAVNGPDRIVDLAQGWRQAEFNIFGDANGSQANFNLGATLEVRVSVDPAAGAVVPPPCTMVGTTGETNNLNLQTAPVFVAPGSSRRSCSPRAPRRHRYHRRVPAPLRSPHHWRISSSSAAFRRPTI